MKTRLILSSIFSLVILFSTSCKKDTEKEHHEHEVITTVEVSFTKLNTAETVVFTWSDVDGPGGANPVIENIVLESGTSYSFSTRFLDQSRSVEEDITEEIEEEADHHRVYYIAETVDLSFSELNKDAAGVTLGLSGKVLTGLDGTGKLQVLLRHYANGGKNESDGPAHPSAGTDADVTFNITLQ